MSNIDLPEWYDREKCDHECGFETLSDKRRRLNHQLIQNNLSDTKNRALRFGIKLTIDECGLDSNNSDDRSLFYGN